MDPEGVGEWEFGEVVGWERTYEVVFDDASRRQDSDMAASHHDSEMVGDMGWQ